MNIMENKRVAAISLVMALAFGGICYYGYGRYNELKETQVKLQKNTEKIERFANEDNPPNAKNVEAATKAVATAKELHDNLQKDLLKYAAFCLAGEGAQTDAGAAAVKAAVNYMPETNANKFQSNFTTLMAGLGARAKEKGCTLDATAARFGNYSAYEKDTAKAEDVPYLNFLLFAANNVLLTAIDSGAPTIKKVYFRELPDAAARKDNILRLSFEVAFTAKRSQLIDPAKPETLSVLPQVLNKITHDSRFFYIPTGVTVTTSGNLPAPSTEQLTLISDSAENSETDEITGEVKTTELLAAPQVGTENDTVDVYLTLQVLYFTSDKL